VGQDYSPYLIQGCLYDDIAAIEKIIDKSFKQLQDIMLLQEEKSARSRNKTEKKLLAIQKNMGNLSQIQFYEQVVAPSVTHILSTISNLHHSELVADCWNVRIQATTKILGGKIATIMQYCEFVKKTSITRCSDV